MMTRTNDGTITSIISWGKNKHTIQIVPTHGVMGLKIQLMELTKVPINRMKLLPKTKGLWKGILQDSEDLTAISYPSKPIELLLVGSSDQNILPKSKSTNKKIFMEDLPKEQLAKTCDPSGLTNLGNTCYVNSVIQCLRVIPLLRSHLRNYKIPNNSLPQNTVASSCTTNKTLNSPVMTIDSMIVGSLKQLYTLLDSSPTAISPSAFIMTSKLVYPHLAQLDSHGMPQQQDAEELLSNILDSCSKEFTTTNNEFPTNYIDKLFGIEMEETLSCQEVTDATTEPPVITKDNHRKLVCNIQGGVMNDKNSTSINTITEGIILSLSGKVEKQSTVLQRNAIWKREQTIIKLPSIIIVQFGRFYWKETPDSHDHTGVKCKVMKPVSFSDTLDVLPFCSKKLQQFFKKNRDNEDEGRKSKKDDTFKSISSVESETMNFKTKNNLDTPTVSVERKITTFSNMEAMANDAVSPGPDLPKDFQGFYELFGVVTHKGRFADGGHYMAWVKDDNRNKQKDTRKDAKNLSNTVKSDYWLVFDDDHVTTCMTEDILKLKGGGDWHMSYLNLYRVKK